MRMERNRYFGRSASVSASNTLDYGKMWIDCRFLLILIAVFMIAMCRFGIIAMIHSTQSYIQKNSKEFFKTPRKFQHEPLEPNPNITFDEHQIFPHQINLNCIIQACPIHNSRTLFDIKVFFIVNLKSIYSVFRKRQLHIQKIIEKSRGKKVLKKIMIALFVCDTGSIRFSLVFFIIFFSIPIWDERIKCHKNSILMIVKNCSNDIKIIYKNQIKRFFINNFFLCLDQLFLLQRHCREYFACYLGWLHLKFFNENFFMEFQLKFIESVTVMGH